MYGKDHRGHFCVEKAIFYRCRKEGHFASECKDNGGQPRSSSNSGPDVPAKKLGFLIIGEFHDGLPKEFEGKVISGFFFQF